MKHGIRVMESAKNETVMEGWKSMEQELLAPLYDVLPDVCIPSPLVFHAEIQPLHCE